TRPGAVFERVAGRRDGAVDVRGGRLGYSTDDLLGERGADLDPAGPGRLLVAASDVQGVSFEHGVVLLSREWAGTAHILCACVAVNRGLPGLFFLSGRRALWQCRGVPVPPASLP